MSDWGWLNCINPSIHPSQSLLFIVVFLLLDAKDVSAAAGVATGASISMSAHTNMSAAKVWLSTTKTWVYNKQYRDERYILSFKFFYKTCFIITHKLLLYVSHPLMFCLIPCLFFFSLAFLVCSRVPPSLSSNHQHPPSHRAAENLPRRLLLQQHSCLSQRHLPQWQQMSLPPLQWHDPPPLVLNPPQPLPRSQHHPLSGFSPRLPPTWMGRSLIWRQWQKKTFPLQHVFFQKMTLRTCIQLMSPATLHYPAALVGR